MSTSMVAQEQPRYTQYMYNKYAFNTAYAGLDGSLSIYTQFRNQWSNLGLNPKTFLIDAHMPIYKLQGAIGIKMRNDHIGYARDQSISLTYNYVKTNRASLWSIGAGIGFRQLGIDGSKLITPEGNYEFEVNHNDPLLSEKYYYGKGMIWEAGAIFINQDIEVGVSVSNVGLNTLQNKLYNTYSNPDIQLFFQYNIVLSKEFIIKPMTLITTDFKTSKIDISAIIEYYGNIFAGISVQSNNKRKFAALGITSGTRLNQNIKVYYSYDIDLSTLRTLHDGTHEIVLNYNLNKIIGKEGKLPIIYSPRNL